MIDPFIIFDPESPLMVLITPAMLISIGVLVGIHTAQLASLKEQVKQLYDLLMKHLQP
jgi:hypothetical protein